jgi:hypothetical protein
LFEFGQAKTSMDNRGKGNPYVDIYIVVAMYSTTASSADDRN